MRYSITASFLAPLLDLRDKAPVNIFGAYYVDSFSADSLNPKYRVWGTHVLMLFNEDLPETLSEYLQSSPSFVETYEPEKGQRMFVFELPQDVRETYIDPVLQGKYSQADRATVDRYFPNDPNHFRYGNRLVFDKSEIWRKDWEKRIGISLPEGAEVWPKAQQKRESYGFMEPSELGLDTTTDQVKVSA